MKARKQDVIADLIERVKVLEEKLEEMTEEFETSEHMIHILHTMITHGVKFAGNQAASLPSQEETGGKVIPFPQRGKR